MKINKAIRMIMRMQGMTLSNMGSSLKKIDKRTGAEKPLSGNDISARLSYDNLSFDKAMEMLDVLGYEIILQEKDKGDLSKKQIVINQKDDTLIRNPA